MNRKILLLRIGFIGFFSIVIVGIFQHNLSSIVLSYITSNILFIYHAKLLFKAFISSKVPTLVLVDFAYDTNMMFIMGLVPLYISVSEINQMSYVLMILGFAWLGWMIYIMQGYFKSKRYVEVYSMYKEVQESLNK